MKKHGTETSGALRSRTKKAAAAGILFGAGFMCGALSGYNYAAGNIVCEVPPISSGVVNMSLPETPGDEAEISADIPDFSEPGDMEDIGLSLQEHWMDSDEHGIYIAGMIKNDGLNPFDAVRVTFDLCDSDGKAYSAVTAKNDERIEPEESWDFTAYLPYSDMNRFDSYRLQSIMGVKR
jgi:hypothetical protein